MCFMSRVGTSNEKMKKQGNGPTSDTFFGEVKQIMRV